PAGAGPLRRSPDLRCRAARPRARAGRMSALRALLYIAFGLCLVIVIGPIIVIIGISFSPVDGFVFPTSGVSLRWYASFLASEQLWGAFLFSFRLALLVSVLSLILGTLAALALARRRGIAAS